MNRNLSSLNPDFSDQVKELLLRCLRRGEHLKPFNTLRDPWDQARTWRRSRSTSRIHRAVQEMYDGGAPWLAGVLEEVGPQHGSHATGALPGRSWHQWGLAIDCYVLHEDSGAIWNPNHAGYKIYAEEATKMGLTPGRLWGDSVHVQLPKRGVIQSIPWEEVEERMIRTFRDV